jgi:hypothetical protein
MSKPYDIFGTWYSDTFFFSGNLHWLGNMVSKSVIWINRASQVISKSVKCFVVCGWGILTKHFNYDLTLPQESQSEHTAVMNELYRFYNAKASSVRSLMIANCVDGSNDGLDSVCASNTVSTSHSAEGDNSGESSSDAHPGNPVSNLSLEQQRFLRANSRGNRGPSDSIADINYSESFRSLYRPIRKTASDGGIPVAGPSSVVESSRVDNIGLTEAQVPSPLGSSSVTGSTNDNDQDEHMTSSMEDFNLMDEDSSTESTSVTPDDEVGQKYGKSELIGSL